MTDDSPGHQPLILLPAVVNAPMCVAIDYDLTYTREPVLFAAIIRAIQAAGHLVICVTGRDAPPAQHEPALPPGVPMLLAPGQFKRAVAERNGYQVSVWIDDTPGAIEPQRFLQWG